MDIYVVARFIVYIALVSPQLDCMLPFLPQSIANYRDISYLFTFVITLISFHLVDC